MKAGQGALAGCLLVASSVLLIDPQSAFPQTPVAGGTGSLGQAMLRRSDRHAKEYEWYRMQHPYINGAVPGIAETKAREAVTQLEAVTADTAHWLSIGPWPAASGSYGEVSGRVTTLAIDPTNPDVMYTGAAEGGVWKTTDGGGNWFPLTDNQPTLATGALAVDPANPNVVYWGTGEPNGCGSLCYLGIGVMKSTDGGESWFLTGLQSPSSSTFRILIDPGATNQVYAATNSGVYRSTDGGVSWTNVHGGSANDLLMNRDTTSVLYAGIGGSGVFRSTDAGSSWAQETVGLPPAAQITRISLAICESVPNVLYAGIYGAKPAGGGDTNRVFLSTNSGQSWAILPAPNYGFGQGWYDNYVAVEPDDPAVAYAGGIDIWRTTDSGLHWTNLTNGYAGGPVHVDQHALAFLPGSPQGILVGNDGGVYRSTDRGVTWSDLNHNLVTIQFYAIAADPNSGYVTYGGTQDNGNQRRMSGTAWQDVTGGDGAEVVVDYSNSRNVYAEYENGYHLKSVDGGFTFFAINTGIPNTESGNWVTPVAIDPVNPQKLYTGTTKFYITTNGGSSWAATGLDVDLTTPANKLSAIGIAPTNPSVVYVGLGDHGVYRSFNGGVKWANVTGTLPHLWVTKTLVHPDSANLAYVTMSGYGADHVWKTTDYGASWASISSGLPGVPVNAITVEPTNHANIYVGTDFGVFRSTDRGSSWSPYMNGLPNVAVNGLEFTSTGTLRAATAGRGMWEYTLPGVVVLATTASPVGGGTVMTPAIRAFNLGDTLTITATPNPGYSFGLWSGDTSTNVNPLHVVMWKNKDLVANFRSLSLPSDAYYTTVNSDRAEVPFSWIELSSDTSAIRIQPSEWHNRVPVADSIDDGTAGPYALGMPFYFYGPSSRKDSIWVGANGAVSLSQGNVNSPGGDGIGYYTSDWSIPGVPIGDFVSPFWNDLYLTPGAGHGDVYYRREQGNKKFVLEWYRAGNFNSSADTATTFELVLDGSTNTVTFQYLDVGVTGLDSTALVGIQRDSATGLMYYHGETVRTPIELKVHDSLAIRFNPRFTVSVAEAAGLPATYSLDQNYPNPFNPKTEVRYLMPEAGNVKLVIYDLLGREVAMLVDGRQEGGVHTVSFDGSNLASGMYFCRLSAGKFTAVKKMLLLK